jgi:hypothetical protein
MNIKTAIRKMLEEEGFVLVRQTKHLIWERQTTNTRGDVLIQRIITSLTSSDQNRVYKNIRADVRSKNAELDRWLQM